MDLQTIIYVIANTFIAFGIDRFMKVFFDKRKTPLKIYLLSYIFYLAITSSISLIVKTPIFNLIATIATLFVITLNYESTKKKKISAVCFIYAFMFVADILSSTVMGYINISPLEKGNDKHTFVLIVTSLLLYLESILAQNFKNIRQNTPVSKMFWLSSFVIPMASVFISIMILNFSNANQITTVSFVVLIFLINILTFYLHDSLSAAYTDKLNSTLLEQEREYYYNQCELMRESTEDLKSFKHDVKNHFSSVIDFIRCDKSNEAIEYLTKLIGEVTFNATYSDTGNTAIDSIINYKLRNAAEQKIELQIDTSVPAKLNIEVTDVITILGNLLDNAINAVLKIEVRKINLKIEFDKGRLFINIENTFNGEIKRDSIGEIISSNIGDEHGYGLKNIQKSVDKYNGYMEITPTDSSFNVDIFLYIKSDISI
ncbi:MAG: GHKL domain-containing protein [Oscillospiraceae bacterium]|jgi:signal transduction histidine kinase|nr:GHKL domain-containing protein [Oscillospiraceae bacterium]